MAYQREKTMDQIDRLSKILIFLQSIGWHKAIRKHMQGDASSRSYERLCLERKQAILMNIPTNMNSNIEGEDKTYSSATYLAEGTSQFIKIAKVLTKNGFSAPKIFASEPENGLLLLEDLGEKTFLALAEHGHYEFNMIEAALDVLISLHIKGFPKNMSLPKKETLELHDYDIDVLKTEVGLILDWMWPLAKKKKCDETSREAFYEIWSTHFRWLDTQSKCWVLRDYHSPNLLWLSDRKATQRVGLIDFQDAVFGHPAYDVVSLLQDARIDIPKDWEPRLLNYYCKKMAIAIPKFDKESFLSAYHLLAAQRAVKNLGIFVRLAVRDNKSDYLCHIKRNSAYLEKNLSHPTLKNVNIWFQKHLPDNIRTLILQII